MTFNAISVELLDTTAEIAFETLVEKAILDLVLARELAVRWTRRCSSGEGLEGYWITC